MKLIILDRDGVINEDSPDYIKSPEEWHPIPGSLDAIAKLNQAGFKVIITTNQSGVGRGYFKIETLKQIHQKMRQAVEEVGGKIDRIYFCPHKPEDDCACRKPKIGMYKQIEREYKTNLHNVINIGDSLRDIQAGQLVGCKNILVLSGKGKETLKKNPSLNNIEIFENLSTAIEHILR